MKAESAVDRAYLACLDTIHGSGRTVSDSNNAPNYAPRVFAKIPEANGYSKQALARAQERLFAARRIEVKYEGPPSKRRARIYRKSVD